ncbi:hypothetical protein L208DRAFT_642959 [Tricholoma matsutake]|nr:hypothetical protein L208DRAFT_642959 [Tricholoma matsutake 945]
MHLFRLVTVVAILFSSGTLRVAEAACACAGPGSQSDIDKCTMKCCDQQYGNYANSQCTAGFFGITSWQFAGCCSDCANHEGYWCL